MLFERERVSVSDSRWWSPAVLLLAALGVALLALLALDAYEVVTFARQCEPVVDGSASLTLQHLTVRTLHTSLCLLLRGAALRSAAACAARSPWRGRVWNGHLLQQKSINWMKLRRCAISWRPTIRSRRRCKCVGHSCVWRQSVRTQPMRTLVGCKCIG